MLLRPLIATGVPIPNNEQVRAHLGGGSLSHISPVMREVVAERDRLLREVRALRDKALPLREQAARLTATREHLATQLNETKVELKGARESQSMSDKHGT